MKIIINAILISQMVFLGVGLRAQSCANPDNIYFFTYAGVNYEIVKENQTWADAAACAVERGGFLSEIDSQEEQDSIFYHLNNAGIDPSNTIAPDGGGASYVWLGGNDIAEEGVWIWDGDNNGVGLQFWQGNYNGTPVNGLYNNWGNEPDNWNNQDGLGLAITDWPLGVAGQWNDVDDSNTLYYVIENSTPVGILENERNDKYLVIYPNPINEKVNIKIQKDEQIVSVVVADVSGKVLLRFDSPDRVIDLSGLTNGLYFLTVNTSENNYIEKVVIR